MNDKDILSPVDVCLESVLGSYTILMWSYMSNHSKTIKTNEGTKPAMTKLAIIIMIKISHDGKRTH